MDAACSHNEGAQKHWALKRGLQYYMAQCPICSTEPGVAAILTSLEPQLPAVAISESHNMAQAIKRAHSVTASSLNVCCR